MDIMYKGKSVYVEVEYTGAACDAFFSAGYYYNETGAMLTDEELEILTESHADEICEYCLAIDGFYKE